MAGTLYTYPDNFRAQRILIAAKISKVDINTPQEPEFTFGESNKNEQFTKKFPLGSVPAFEFKDGLLLFETNAIMDYVANDQLRGGNDAKLRAQIRQWIEYADNTLLQPVMTLFLQGLGLAAPAKDVVEHARSGITQQLQFLDRSLAAGGSTNLVGNQITLADIAVFSVLKEAYKSVIPTQMRQQYKSLWKWFENIAGQAAIEAVVGKLKLCEVEPASLASVGSGGDSQQGKKNVNSAASDAQQGAKKGGKDGKQQQQEKPAAQEKPAKAAKPKAKAESEDEPEEEDDEMKDKPSKDPLAHLPAGTFNLEDFKRFFSNNPPETFAPYFWEKFDAANYSIWYCEYKYPEELGMTFMSANLVGGMFQRLEKLHKYAFASMCVFGKNSDNQISGIWVFRGQDLVFPLDKDWQTDYESYDWKKLDLNNAETKPLVEQYLKEEGERHGKPYATSKVYK